MDYTYSLRNSLGQDTGVHSLSLLQGIFPTQVSLIVGGFFTSWATGEPILDTLGLIKYIIKILQ